MRFESADEKLRPILKSTKEQVFSNKGIISFSKFWNNPVVWSHYADCHRGLCLGFYIPDEWVTQISYVTERLAIGLCESNVKEILNENFQKKLIATKFKHWKYENEARVFCKLEEIDPVTGLHFKEFGNDLSLKEVIIGVHYVPNPNNTELEKGLINNGVNIITARLGFTSFSVSQQKERTDWKNL